MPRPLSPARVVGPTWLPSRGQYRVVVRDGTGGRSVQTYRGLEGKDAAEKFAGEARRRLGELAETKVSAALTQYEEHLLVNRRNKPRSAADTLYRLRRFFSGSDSLLRSMTAARCRSLYEMLVTHSCRTMLKDGTVKDSPLLSPDSRLDILATVKTFFRWCVDRGLLPANPAEKIKDDASRNHGGIGRTVLRAKELRALFGHAAEKAKAGDQRAIGVLMALLLGMRSGEIVRCQVRDIDDARWIIEIPIESAKTAASARLFAVPDILQPLLARQLKGRAGDRYLLGKGEKPHDRGWVTDTVSAYCTKLRFPKIESAHGLRGAHNDLARQAGSTGDEVVRQLGHENESTTRRSYTSRIGREAISSGQQSRVLGVLQGGKR